MYLAPKVLHNGGMAETIDLDDEVAEGASKHSSRKWITIGILVVTSLAFLVTVRIVLVSPFDSAITRFGCINHAAYLNDLDEPDRSGPPLDDRNTETVKRLVDEGVTWQVEGHVRSNKLGLIDRDDAACVYSTNLRGEDNITIPMSLASHGIFYDFGKVLGILLQIGLLSGFFRWYHFRFIAEREL